MMNAIFIAIAQILPLTTPTRLQSRLQSLK